jgi:hypothetical protein
MSDYERRTRDHYELLADQGNELLSRLEALLEMHGDGRFTAEQVVERVRTLTGNARTARRAAWDAYTGRTGGARPVDALPGEGVLRVAVPGEMETTAARVIPGDRLWLDDQYQQVTAVVPHGPGVVIHTEVHTAGARFDNVDSPVTVIRAPGGAR